MKSEIEVKFLNIDKKDLRKKIIENRGTLIQSEVLQKRKTFDFKDRETRFTKGVYKWLRVRDEGNKITMTMKHHIESNAIDDTKEVEIVVDDFDAACEMILEMDFEETNYQENYRETWDLDGAQVTIDTWPGLEPLVEIEGETEELVRSVSIKLGFDWSQTMFGPMDYVYEKEYGIDPNGLTKIKKLTFENWKEVLVK